MNAAAMSEPQPYTRTEIPRILIADDQQHILDSLEILLGAHGFSTEAATHPSRVLHALETQHFDAVLMDLNYTRGTTEGGEGLELVSRIRALDSLLPVIVLTAWSSIDLAVDAMRRGASDFVQKPWDNHELLQKLQTQLSRAREQRRAKRLHDEELQEARQIQDSLLPTELPKVAGYEVAAMTQPLRFVGGDYYSVVRISDRYTAFCIADVAGKGLPAALLMSSLQAALQPLISQSLAPRELCRRLNRILCDLTPVGKFISFFYAVLDNFENRLIYCNAGHNPPLLVRSDGQSAELKSTGAVLGQFPYWVYEQSELQMKSGDRLLLFTDGLVEACDPSDEPFGEHNVIRIARENAASRAGDLMALLINAASQHTDGHFQDDASLIVLKATAEMR
jgi:sigma-B regulation protein RsbU (phosphoserine phosphatase)